MNRMIIILLVTFTSICCVQEPEITAPPAPPAFKSYLVGDKKDVQTQPQGGVCLMSGGGEDDEAMRWFLRRSAGGDVVVLRASGSDGYNNYMYKDLGVNVNSVESIVFEKETAARDPYVLQQIADAEAIWFAGGDQWNYIKYWRNTAVDSIINANIIRKKIVIGGLSAGMAILGTPYFSAQLGSITSETALKNPLSDTVAVQNKPFLNIPYLQHVITDTHYAERKRQGRHVVFLAKAYNEFNIPVKGIACDEESAICIDNDGKAYVFGNYPVKPHAAYFIQINCNIKNNTPEVVMPGKPLHWVRDSSALKVYEIKAEPGGKHYFDLKDWKTGSGGTWKHWYVVNGEWKVGAGTAPDCR
ncbi:MAG: cyanophycinase [Saprospiraceae bacterium]